ncbi:unnamed protein product [Parnassius apollo]|uniref:(apollo) hypothetical protein n=1 Tax=Parnassius apollo TaxID=110799 RepID=A0A8S3WK39_PARAO|nr:unnamed protein product [Parnassius apollo]
MDWLLNPALRAVGGGGGVAALYVERRAREAGGRGGHAAAELGEPLVVLASARAERPAQRQHALRRLLAPRLRHAHLRTQTNMSTTCNIYTPPKRTGNS